MADFLTAFLMLAACGVLALVVIGMVRILRGPSRADRLMAAQLLGSGSVAIILLLAFAGGRSAFVDIALTLALLAAFASVAFSLNALGGGSGAGEP
ncbi:monovalent cation/H+ antiporter complex subunit F [Kaistia algarum]|uniref:monovalent cation/H+ antiporter complex subunit F n=1 Tax=Kaistia algarum TaxID=2083279 RepID=UPI00225ADA0A|nr:monovalent cation/H+ antiporter complex subunit F [Kaistia algarum]MCX5514690.1 monovalent cation/H+ antiporter complex subunit F [Kaistia algarum]